MKLRRTCKEICALLVAREDRTLFLPERAAVRLHLFVCRNCPRFAQQLVTMGDSLKRWRGYQSNED